MKGLVCVLALMAACGGDDGDSSDAAIGGGDGEPENLMGITAAHNQIRAAVDTTGSSGGQLPPMVWDSDLAAHAQAWTAMCKDDDGNGLTDHSSTAYRSNAAGYSYIGENVFGSGGAASAQQAVNTWGSEKQNFTYPSGCSGVCGHYTQVVWRTSVNLGCANVTCGGHQYPGTILCMYGPGGNSGGAPY